MREAHFSHYILNLLCGLAAQIYYFVV